MNIILGGDTKERSWFKVASAGAETAAQAFALGKDGFSAAISSFFRAVESARGDDTASGRLETLIFESQTYAITSLLSSNIFVNKANSEQIEHIITCVLLKAKSYIKDNNVIIEPRNYIYPTSIILFDVACDEYLVQTEFLTTNLSVEAHKAKFFSTIQHGWMRIRARKPRDFQIISDVLFEDGSEADTRTKAWEEYSSVLQARFEDQLLFGQDESKPIYISQIYQPLRAYWFELAETDTDDLDPYRHAFPSHGHSGSIYIDYIDGFVSEWLASSSNSDKIRLISGGPGSGKSTFAKYFASKIALREDWSVLLVPLQRIRASGDLGSRIDDYFIKRLDEPFTEQCPPLSTFGRDHRSNLLIIFDGLDELAKEGTSSETAAQDFASLLIDWKGRMGSKINLKCIVLGRAPSMQEARRRLNLHGQGTLYLVDMLPFGQHISVQFSNKIDLLDRNSLAKLDQRSDFWKKWAAASGSTFDIPDSMLATELEDLTKEPLLAYLLILSGYANDNWRIAAANRNYIYRSIFDKIWTRESSKPARVNLRELGKTGFDAVMQALGLAAWRGGGRTGDEATFNTMRDVYIKYDVLENAKQCGIANLGSIALLFYTQKDEHEGKGYEFLHKSFGEYLVARALLDAFVRWSSQVQNPDSDFTTKDFLGRWFKIAGQNHLTGEILGFLRNEVSAVANSSVNQPWIVGREWANIASKLLSYAIKHGHPFDINGNSWRELEAQHINAEINLLGVLDACSRVAYPSDKFGEDKAIGGWEPGPVKVLAFMEKSYFSDFYSRASTVYSGLPSGRAGGGFLFEHPLVHNLLSRLSINFAYFNSSNLYFLDLEGSKIDRLSITGGFGQFCDFSNLIIRDGHISKTDLFRSNFDGSVFLNCTINSSEFQSCEFIGTVFNSCRIVRCVFSNIDFSKTIFGDKESKFNTTDTYTIGRLKNQSVIVGSLAWKKINQHGEYRIFNK